MMTSGLLDGAVMAYVFRSQNFLRKAGNAHAVGRSKERKNCLLSETNGACRRLRGVWVIFLETRWFVVACETQDLSDMEE